MKRILFGFLFLIFSNSTFSQVEKSLLDSVSFLNEKAYDFHNKNPSKTLEYSRIVLELLKGNDPDYNFHRCVAYKNIGLAYWRTAAYDSGLFYQQKSQVLAEEIQSDSLLAKVWSNIGLIYQEKGQYALSLYNSFRALKKFEDLGDDNNFAIVSFNIGEVYKRLGDFEEAIKYYKQSYQIGQEIDDKLIQCGNQVVFGELEFYNGRNASSIEKLNEALEYCKKAELRYFISECYYQLAVVQLAMDSTNEAIASYISSYRIKQELGDKKGQSALLIDMSEIHLKRKEYLDAESHLEEAFELARENGLLFQSRDYYRQKIALDSLKGDYTGAFNNYGKLLKLEDSINQFNEINEISDVITQYQTDALLKEKEIQSQTIKSQQVQTRFIYLLLGMAFMVIIGLIYFIRRTSITNEELRLLNDEISQQKKNLEAKSIELENTSKLMENKNSELEDTLKKLKEAQSRLIESEKMASLGLLSAGLGHEINNPLNFIKGGVTVLNEHINESNQVDKERIKEYLQIISSGVDRAASIIRSLSKFSRSGSMMNERCDLHEIIENCLIILNNQIRDRIEIEKNYNDKGLILAGNAGRLHQVFLNILSNAEAAISDRGKITINTINNGDTYIIEISDTGSGIPEEFLPKIMDPFFTTKPPGQGTGLGLSISYNIVKEHQGKIDVESLPAKGTKFTVTFDLS